MKQLLLGLLNNKFKKNKNEFIVSLINSEDCFIRKQIIERTNFLIDPIFSQRVWHILEDLLEPCKCECGNYTEFLSFTIGYDEFCSSECKYKSLYVNKLN